MIQLDDNFLQDLGVGGLPDDQKQAILAQVYEELEMRVGTQLSENLSDEQMAEFDAIIRQDEEKIRGWLNINMPDYAQREDYQAFMQSAQQDVTNPSLATLVEFVSSHWLAKNSPDFKEVVAATIDEIKREIMGSRDAILSAA